jgi:hypothetical protein
MILKQTLFLLSAAAMLTGSASAADMPLKAPAVVEQPQRVSGYVELYGGWARLNTDSTSCFNGICGSSSDETRGWALGGAGRATWWWAPSFSVQLDAQGEGTSYKVESTNFFQRVSAHNYLIGAHANWRDPQRGLIGIFGGAGDTTVSLASASARHGLIGVEAQYYLGPVTLYGQGGYNSTLGAINNGTNDIHAWFARGTGRLYLVPNFRLEGTVLYADGSVSFSSLAPGITQDFRTWLWRAKGEYRFATTPFSLFAYYEGSRTTIDFSQTLVGIGTITGNNRTTDHRIIGGLRLYINEGTLQANDRNGTTLDIIAPMSVPSFAFGGGPS